MVHVKPASRKGKEKFVEENYMVEKITEAISEIEGVDENYSEELKKEAGAVFVLANLPYTEFEYPVLQELERLKRKILYRIEFDPDEENGSTPIEEETPKENGEEEEEEEEEEGYLPISPIFLETLKNVTELNLPKFGKPIDGTKPPEFPPIRILKGLIGEHTKPFEKQLTASDLRDTQSRVTIPRELFEKYIQPLMNETERGELVSGINVMVYDSKGRDYQMILKIWAHKIHVLMTVGWKKFYIDNEFVAMKDWITIWVFKHVETGKLCFAMIARRFPMMEGLIKKKK